MEQLLEVAKGFLSNLGDNTGVIALAITIVVALVVVYKNSKNTHDFLLAVYGNKEITGNIQSIVTQFPVEKREQVIKWLDVMNPLTKTTASDLDDETLKWVKSLLADTEVQG